MRSYTYEQATGIVLTPSGEVIGKGYSGFGAGKNNAEAQEIESLGPIPRGVYEIGEPHDSPHVGPYAMRLTPLSDTNTFNRSDFLIHGDSQSHPGAASHGCIVLPFPVRKQIWESGDRAIEVVHG